MTNIKLLRLLDLPLIADIRDLAAQMHLDYDELKNFVIYANLGYYYKEYTIRKKSGGWREIKQPGRRLKAIQAWILRHILDKLTPSPYAFAFRRNRGLLDALVPHTENRYYLCMDIEEFFPSITKYRVWDVFSTVGYSSLASDILASLCTCRRALPQGGITSPSLSNLVVSRMDRRIAGYAAIHNVVYSRYADDMIMSTNNPDNLNGTKAMIRRIVKEEKYKINEKKTRYMGPKVKCRILGIIKNNSEPRYGIGREKRRRMRAIIYNAIINDKYDSDYPTVKSISGWLHYAHSVDLSTSEKLNSYAKKLLKRKHESETKISEELDPVKSKKKRKVKKKTKKKTEKKSKMKTKTKSKTKKKEKGR